MSADDPSAVMIDVMSTKHIVSGYLILQAGGTLAWWVLLLLFPASVAWFHPAGWRSESLISFWLGDSVLLIFGSLLTAIAIFREKSIATIAIWALTAAVWYPTLYCIGVSLMTDEAWIASAMMGSMAGLTLAMATIHGNENQKLATIRVTPMTKTAAVAWTFAQTILFWSMFLWIFPKGVVEIEHRLGWQSFSHDFQGVGSVYLFLAASVLGLSSGMIMATRGRGTPLPTATAPRLVVVGPYHFVRNPMAVSGILKVLRWDGF